MCHQKEHKKTQASATQNLSTPDTHSNVGHRLPAQQYPIQTPGFPDYENIPVKVLDAEYAPESDSCKNFKLKIKNIT